jgi:hypothetical protein
MRMVRVTLFDFGRNLAMSPGHWLNAGESGSSVPCMEEGVRRMRSMTMSRESVVAKTEERKRSCERSLA